ncbi:MAG TPA: hypothetical protein VM146_08625 [Steroidobacteraceae bacterium]|nr:hypothetical protein [Steroidobacteraceae bacterium]
MKFPLTFALLLASLFSGTAQSQDSAGLFFYGPAPTVDDIARVAGGATVSSEQVEAVTRVTIAWPDVSVIIHVSSDWPRDEQLASIRGELAERPSRERNRPAVKQFLANLDRTTVCWGSLIDPGYDREGKVAAFLTRLIGISGGFLFTYQSFYSSDGRRITGLQQDPAILQ